MKKSILAKVLLLSFLALASAFAYAERDKVIQVVKNGEIIQEFPASEIDYIEVNDLIAAPESVSTSVSASEITISWNGVPDAKYNVYRSADNKNFTLIASDLSETTYTDKSPLVGTNYYSVTAIIDGNESKHSQSNAAVFTASDLPSGIYLGITGFSNGFQSFPIAKLSDENIASYKNFINGLTATEIHTWLYLAVDEAVNHLQESQFPKDLTQVAVVTFTDGQDQGSLDELERRGIDKYLTTKQYRDDLHNRLTTEKVSGTDMSAYTIGIIPSTASSLTIFRHNMNSLATSSANIYEVSDIAQLNNTFKEIANSLSKNDYVQRFVLSISGQSHNEKCRFTFDDVTSYSASKLYIEGIYNRLTKSLTDVRYVGLTSSSGSTVQGVYNTEKSKYEFTFEKLKADDGQLIPTNHVQHWFTDEGIWQDADDEFEFPDKDAGLEKIKRSVAIMLNLDCSYSMNGEKLAKLKEATNSFVQVLADNTIDPSEVSSVSLDKTSATLECGKGLQLKATVLPATAKLKTVSWTTSNPDVATVKEAGDQEAVVTAVAPGTAIITSTTKDGGYTATCRVKVVKQAVKEIKLSHSSLALNAGGNMQLNATALPATADNTGITWSSSKPTVATVSAEGLVNAVSPGTATITASAADGSLVNAKCSVTVGLPVTGISLSESSLKITKGANGTLKVSILPTNATNYNYTVKSSNESVASVSTYNPDAANLYVYVKGEKYGTATITVTSEDGAYTASAEVEVTPTTLMTHLALSVKKNGVRYYIPASEYASSGMPAGYTKEGITISNGYHNFVLALSNSTTSRVTWTNAQSYGTLPSINQAAVIAENWTAVNSALTTFGGTSLGSNSYWTNASRGTNGQGYYFSSSGTAFATSTSATNYVRRIVATL